ncbi:MAG: 50S ribosomal protein L15 [Ruminococcus sp.]|nr:50S ribosomal protein L15 [Ruminococcus sp.]
MKLHELSPVEGSKKRSKRIGRGHGSGWGKTSGKGQKGQKSRSGGSIRPGFEGGQMPLQRRVPKRGFNNIFAKNVVAVNLSVLNRKFNDGDTVNCETLKAAGVIKNGFDAVKVLGNGKLEKKLNVELPLIRTLVIKKKDGSKEEKKVCPYSESAKAAIEAAGGKAEVI